MELIKFSKIFIDDSLRTRPVSRKKLSRLCELITIGEYPPPMLVMRVNGQFQLLDGFHRYAAWEKSLDRNEMDISVNVVDAVEEKKQYELAIKDNIGQGDNYSPNQINALYGRLVFEIGFTKKEAKSLLKIDSTRAEKIEIVILKANSAQKPEQPIEEERATFPEEPAAPERAESNEKSSMQELATIGEQTITPERPNYKDIQFHVERLRKIIPSAWTDVLRAVEVLSNAIIAEMKKEQAHE